MGELALAYESDFQYQDICEYLGTENGFWIKNDIWKGSDAAFEKAGIVVDEKVRNWIIADFSYFENDRLKNEAKYLIVVRMKENSLSALSCSANYLRAIRNSGKSLKNESVSSFRDVDEKSIRLINESISKSEQKTFHKLKKAAVTLVQGMYDEQPELDKDVWHALLIPGVKLSAAIKRQSPSMSFEKIPTYYRESVKRYMKSLIYRRSWSFCKELLMYIRYFYKSFYGHSYEDGFQEELKRTDMENYLGWVAEDYENYNATFRSKAVSFIRNWLDFIQLAEFESAPRKDITRLIYEDDIPRRERVTDTLEKIKYIPEPIRIALDAAIEKIEPPEMKAVYILLRETGWRGTDILNLRYDQCLDYVWNSHNGEYVPYLYDEITKTGIPMHKIPLRTEVAEMVRGLIDKAKVKSTEDNNPDRYLFNTYEGKSKGLPYSKPAFAAAVQELIERQEIRDGKGDIYHFKTHSLRHTRAMEYTEQGMPIGIIQQILGHCSLQMTLHYSKVSEDMLYKKWKETEKLDLFQPASQPPNPNYPDTEEIHYEFVRKSLDAVRVPFGTCFKPSKITCKNQTQMCLGCTSFCSTTEDLPSYDAEIKRVKELMTIGETADRSDWVEKNRVYLGNLESMKTKILQERIVHKNGNLREDTNG
ncbi:MAG: tyrosine-type recombinase/integrase [Velocimicrobium sp.]